MLDFGSDPEKKNLPVTLPEATEYKRHGRGGWAKTLEAAWNLMDSPNAPEAITAFQKAKQELARLGMGFAPILTQAKKANETEGKLKEALLANRELGEQNRLLKRENDVLRAKDNSIRRRFKRAAKLLAKCAIRAAIVAAPSALYALDCIDVSGLVFSSAMLFGSVSVSRLFADEKTGYPILWSAAMIGGFGTALAVPPVLIGLDQASVETNLRTQIDVMAKHSDFGPKIIKIVHPVEHTTDIVEVVGKRYKNDFSIPGHSSDAGECVRYWISSITVPSRTAARKFPPPPDKDKASTYYRHGTCRIYNSQP